MINKRRKKKGASLLVVVAMMAILSVLIVSLLAMTTSGYKLRVDSNNRVEGFYGADSGLEISEKVLQDYLKANIETSNKAVSSSLDVDEKNKEFKKSFNKFIIEGGKSTKLPLYDNPTLISGEYEYKPLIEEIIINEYYKKFDRKDVSIENVKLYYTMDINKSNYQELVYPVTLSEDTMALIKGFRLELESEYKKNSKTRRVAVKFNIDIPDYGKKLVDIKSGMPEVLDYIFGVDGNYNLNANTTISVLGDMWVKGKDVDQNNLKEDKYKNGINIYSTQKNNPNVSWDGNITTAANFNIKDVDLTIGNKTTDEQKIFARNVIVEANNSLKTLFGENLDVYVYNDFVYNSKNSKLNMNNLYAINDINNYHKNIEGQFKLDESERSSSIIINSEDFGDGSSINIAKDMYVLGSSYLDLTKPYQTGQSVVINQISSPYTVRYDGYIYEYDNKGKVHIVKEDKNGKELNLLDKAKLVTDKPLTEVENKFAKGLTATNIYNTAAVLANNDIIAPKMNFDMKSIEEKQKEYAKEVFYMGNKDKKYSTDDFWRKEVDVTVASSFDWRSMKKLTDDYGKCENCDKCDAGEVGTHDNHCRICDLCKLSDNNTLKAKEDGFLHLETKKTVDDIISDSKKNENENSNLHEYELGGGIGTKPINIILNSSDKKLKIKQVDKIPEGKDLISDDGTTITYYFVDGVNAPYPIVPLLVISKTDVEFETSQQYNYSMLLSAGDATLSILAEPGWSTIVGNYATQSKNGEWNLINELFKYSLSSDGALSGIGGEIFNSKESKIANESIEISDLIKREKWQLIK